MKKTIVSLLTLAFLSSCGVDDGLEQQLEQPLSNQTIEPVHINAYGEKYTTALEGLKQAELIAKKWHSSAEPIGIFSNKVKRDGTGVWSYYFWAESKTTHPKGLEVSGDLKKEFYNSLDINGKTDNGTFKKTEIKLDSDKVVEIAKKGKFFGISVKVMFLDVYKSSNGKSFFKWYMVLPMEDMSVDAQTGHVRGEGE